MSRDVNKVIMVGRAGRDPDMQEGPGQEKIAHLTLATDNGEERTDFHRLTFRGRLAQFAEDYITEGARIYIEGKLHYDSYERDGVVIPTAEIEVAEVVHLTRTVED